MPEYLAPGVFVEETSFRQKSIEGVATSTTAFIGPTRTGPVEGPPPLLTSFLEFERVYGGIDRLRYGGVHHDNHLAHAVRAFFDEGGRRLYVVRTYSPPANGDTGRASGAVGGLAVEARHPGEAGNFTVTFNFQLGRNIVDEGELRGGRAGDTVLVVDGAGEGVYWLDNDPLDGDSRVFRQDGLDGAGPHSRLADLGADAKVHVITVNVLIDNLGEYVDALSWENLGPHGDAFRRDSMQRLFAGEPADRATELRVPLVLPNAGSIPGHTIVQTILGQDPNAALAPLLDDPPPGQDPPLVSIVETLTNGSDGEVALAGRFAGDENNEGLKSGFLALADVDDISIVAAPGSTADMITDDTASMAIQRELVKHCEKMRYRVAVLDTRRGKTPMEIRTYRAKFDSKYAALYYPWVKVFDPLTRQTIAVPPSGHMAGIWARNDITRGVHKAPANEVVRSALDFEIRINTGQQEVLNPEGINCLRFMRGRGFRVWGARTVSSDPEWKYVSTRRLFVYLERSIDVSTQWAVFEPNGEELWANVRRTVEDFLYNEWRSGRLAGTSEDEAYFVKCDRSTMTQNDLDNGRMICLIGVAPLYPAEFVIFRIGQKTLESRGPGLD